MYNQMKLYQ